MTGAILMFSCVILIGVSLHLFLSGLRQAETDRVPESGSPKGNRCWPKSAAAGSAWSACSSARAWASPPTAWACG